MRVRDIERSPAITCEPDAQVSQVARMMREQRVGSVFVVDEIGAVVGVVTDRDLVERVIAPEREPPPEWKK